MSQAMAARKRRRVRRPPCSRGHLLSAILATLLLFNACDGYMSTMHLGRTLKALRARELEDQEPEQQQEQKQEQKERGSLPPPGASASPSPDQRYAAEDAQEDSRMGALGPVKECEHETVATHPSWGGETTDAHGKAATIQAANERGFEEEAAGGVDLAGEGAGLLEEEEKRRQDEPGRKLKPPSSPVTAAAAATAAAGAGVGGLASASRQAAGTAGRTATRLAGEGGGESKQRGSRSERAGLALAGEGDNDEAADENVAARVAGAPAAGATGLLDEGSSSGGGSGVSIPADHLTAATDVEVGLEDSVASTTSSTTTTALFGVTAAAAPAAAATPALQQDSGLEEDQEEDGNECSEEEVTQEEEVEAAAIREILSRRAARDLEVQAAAAEAVEALPATQRECFEEVKAFAFGGAGRGGGEEEEGLTEEEIAALDTVAICGDRDGVVLAFLRHSKFDVRKAKESMRRCCAWRSENEADDIFKRAVSPAKMRKHRTHWPTGFHKEDRAGRPVFYDRVGQSDLTKLRAEPDGLDQDEMVQIFTQNMEARRRFVLTRLSREAGHPVDQMTTVLDLTGLGMRHMSKEAVSYTRRISDVFQDNYSGMTCSLLILNAPWVFSKGWQVIEGFLSEDTVAKVKVLGKGEAGLAQLEEYIPKENIPEFLGGESPAIIGPSDPLWADVDSAVRSWAGGGDPFLDQAEVDRVSGRIRRERERASQAKSKSKSKSKPKSKAEVKSRSKSKPQAKPKAGEQLPPQGEEEEGRLAPAVEQERAPSAAGVDDGGGRGAPVRSSRRATAAAAAAVAVAAGGRARPHDNSGGRRGKSRRRSPEDAGDTEEGTTKLAREDREKDKDKDKEREKKRHRRQRGGLVSSSSAAAAAAAAGRPSSSSSRRRAAPPPSSLPSPPTKATTAAAAARAAKGSSGRGSILRGSAAQGALAPPSRAPGGKEGRGRGRRSHKGGRRKQKKSVRWEDEDEEAAQTEEEEEDGGADGDDGRAVAGDAFGERVLGGFGRGALPVLRAWLSHLVAGLLAAVRVLLSAAEKLFRFLRDAFFEQVEVED